ncbi:hypothetical protein ACFSTC_25055 [Nonomuraea ferruginea]
MSAPALSRHLRVLRAGGLVRAEAAATTPGCASTPCGPSRSPRCRPGSTRYRRSGPSSSAPSRTTWSAAGEHRQGWRHRAGGPRDRLPGLHRRDRRLVRARPSTAGSTRSGPSASGSSTATCASCGPTAATSTPAGSSPGIRRTAWSGPT